MKRIAPISILLLGITACADGPPPSTGDENQSKLPPEQKLERPGTYRQIPVPNPAQSEGEITTDVPDATITATKDDLARKLGILPDAIDVVIAKAVVWNDGSLGCGQPGQAYIQAVTPGYHVILEAKGKRYDYRATEQGYFLLCELPRLVPAPAIKKR